MFRVVMKKKNETYILSRDTYVPITSVKSNIGVNANRITWPKVNYIDAGFATQNSIYILRIASY